jgi:hypothetical protein
MIAQANPTRSAVQSRRALKKPGNTADQPPAWHERFLQMLPNIVRHARLRFRGLPPAMREEAILDAVAHAYVAYARLVQLGKEDVAFAAPLARYVVSQYWGGRRVGTRLNVRDVLSGACRKRNGLRIERLDRFDGTTAQWQEVLVEDRRFGPAEAAAAKLDFAAWLSTLSKRDCQLAEKLATGESTSGAARCFGISEGRVSQLRRELLNSWRLFQGELCPAHA